MEHFEFSDRTIRLHRNLLVLSVITIVILRFNISITNASIFGATFENLNDQVIHTLLLLSLAYHLVAFGLSASQQALGLFLTSRKFLDGFHKEIEDEIKDQLKAEEERLFSQRKGTEEREEEEEDVLHKEFYTVNEFGEKEQKLWELKYNDLSDFLYSKQRQVTKFISMIWKLGLTRIILIELTMPLFMGILALIWLSRTMVSS